MRNFITYLHSTISDKNISFRVKLFHVILVAAVCISFVMTMFSLVISVTCTSIILSSTFTLLSIGMLLYVYKTKDFHTTCIIGGILYYLILFPIAFFLGGGFESGMHSSFIFAVFFTMIMLEREDLLLYLPIQIVLYSCCIAVGYYFPQFIVPITSSIGFTINSFSIITVGAIILGFAMVHLLQKSEVQQKQLVQARSQAENASRAKGTFLANMSHEIRTQINIILGTNELIARESPTTQISQYSSQVQASGQMLLDIVSNILDISEIEAGKMTLFQTHYHTKDFLYSLVAGSKLNATKGHLAFITDIDDNLPSVLKGDETRLKQVVSNLLSNAIKYTPKGSVTLKVRFSPLTEGAILLRICVTDTGIGIKKDALPHLFDAFYRSLQPSSQSIAGTGLGLSIAKDLTTVMNGTLSVESTLGSGSIFTLEVPQTVVDDTPIGSLHFQSILDNSKHISSFLAPEGRILIVDDHVESALMVRDLLQHTLLKIDIADSANHALRLMSANSYHIVLLDYTMPEMTGSELLQAIKSHGLQKDTPIIALTALVLSSEEQLLSEGFAAVLRKPVAWTKLEQVILSFLPSTIIDEIYSFTTHSDFSEDFRKKLVDGLKEYDIDLLEGLRFCGDDLLHYQKRAQILTKSFSRAKKLAEQLLVQRDFSALSFEIHSLKANAHALGAIDLYYHAARMEKRCSPNCDEAYIEHAMPLLLLEWERANNGIQWLLEELSAEIVPTVYEQPAAVSNETVSACRLHAMEAITSLQWKRAKNELCALITFAEEEAERALLTKVYNLVDNLQFEQAETLFANYLFQKECTHG